MREKLEEMATLVHDNLTNAQKKQKQWSAQNAREREFTEEAEAVVCQNGREREFKEGEQVLILLPTTNENLSTHWQGPYQVLKLVGKVDYLVDMHDNRNRQNVLQ